jgi:hypothetical protein
LEANALNIANWRQSKDEQEKNMMFNKLMAMWPTPNQNHIHGHNIG